MRIYLVQQGKAKSKQEDPSRPLTAEGIQESAQTSELFSRTDISVSRILHSGKDRAQQTAYILALEIQPRPKIETREGLAPMDDPQQIAEALAESFDDVVMVGHLPHLERLTSLLLTEKADQNSVTFQNSGIVCLERDQRNSWSLRWAITPQLTGQTAATTEA